MAIWPQHLTMKLRLRNLVLAPGVSWMCWAWCRLGVFVYQSSVVAATEEGERFPDGLFVFISIAWGVLLVVLLACAIWSWKQVFRPSKTTWLRMKVRP